MFDNTYNKNPNDIGYGLKKQNKKNRSAAMNVGGAIVIVIFVVLCLTIFGLLSFTTAYADKKLADRNLASISQYYSADSKAEEILAQLYSSLNENPNADVNTVVSGLDVVEKYEDENGAIGVLYVVHVNDVHSIKCDVVFYMDTQTNVLHYNVKTWNVVITGDLVYGDEFYDDIWTGEFD